MGALHSGGWSQLHSAPSGTHIGSTGSTVTSVISIVISTEISIETMICDGETLRLSGASALLRVLYSEPLLRAVKGVLKIVRNYLYLYST